MSKLEKLDSKLFKTFINDEIQNIDSVLGGATSRRKDCNASGANDGDWGTGWGKDSKRNTNANDTVRADDGCNEKSVSSTSTTVLVGETPIT